jgi:thymidylate synthase (FAD)
VNFVKNEVILIKDKNIYERIEYAGRNCYKSANSITETSSEGFIKGRMVDKHFSILEHSNIVVKYVFHDIDDAAYAYQWMQSIVGESKARIFITGKEEELVISGNARGWMDYFNWKVKTNYYGEDEYIKNIQEVLQKNYPLFFGESKNKKKNKYISIITEDEGELYDPIHKSYTFEVHTNRAISHQIVRHRDLSFSQESQRYCNYSLNKFNNELNFNVNEEFYRRNKEFIDEIFSSIENKYIELTKKHNGVSLEKTEDVRMFLPNASATVIMITGRKPHFEDFFEKRIIPKAQAEIREIAEKMKNLIEEEERK